MTNRSRRAFLRDASSFAAGAVAAPFALVREQLDDRLARARFTRDDFTLDPAITYLNHGSIGTMPRAVQEAHHGFLRALETNPWLHLWSGKWEDPREEVRAAAARFLGTSPECVAITHSTTEGFSILAGGLPLAAGDEVLFSNLNHSGASVSWEHQAKVRGYSVRRFEIPLAEVPTLSEDDLVRLHVDAIGDATRVLVLPHVDNMVGVRHPIHRIAEAAKAKGVRYVFVDAAQTVAMLPVEVGKIDGFATSPHKWLQSPKGLGLLCLSKELIGKVVPSCFTWGQARWDGTARIYEDFGTRDLPDVLALGAAIEYHERRDVGRGAGQLRKLRDMAVQRVLDTKGLEWASPEAWRTGASLFAVKLVDGRSAGAVGKELWEKQGIVVRAFGGELNTLRVSPNFMNDAADLKRFFEALG